MAKDKKYTCMACGHVGAAAKNKVWKAKCCAACGSLKVEEGESHTGIRYGVCACGSSSFRLGFVNHVLLRTCNVCNDVVDPSKIKISGGTKYE